MPVQVAMATVCFDYSCIPQLKVYLQDQLQYLGSKITMPLFSNKFAAKSIPVRRQDTSVIKNEFGSDYAAKELSLDVGPLKLKLGDFEVSFEEGQWIPGK